MENLTGHVKRVSSILIETQNVWNKTLKNTICLYTTCQLYTKSIEFTELNVSVEEAAKAGKF